MRRFATRTRRGAQQGFTLIEVMIAMTVLAVGLLSLAMMQLHALRGGNVGRHSSTAAIVARDRMESFQRAPWATVTVTAGWVNDGNVTNSVQATAGTAIEQTYTREYQVRNVTTGWIRAVDVRITWNEAQDQNKQLVLSSMRYNW
jgi:type IV pilus assembly protein PilV